MTRAFPFLRVPGCVYDPATVALAPSTHGRHTDGRNNCSTSSSSSSSSDEYDDERTSSAFGNILMFCVIVTASQRNARRHG